MSSTTYPTDYTSNVSVRLSRYCSTLTPGGLIQAQNLLAAAVGTARELRDRSISESAHTDGLAARVKVLDGQLKDWASAAEDFLPKPRISRARQARNEAVAALSDLSSKLHEVSSVLEEQARTLNNSSTRHIAHTDILSSAAIAFHDPGAFPPNMSLSELSRMFELRPQRSIMPNAVNQAAAVGLLVVETCITAQRLISVVNALLNHEMFFIHDLRLAVEATRLLSIFLGAVAFEAECTIAAAFLMEGLYATISYAIELGPQNSKGRVRTTIGHSANEYSVWLFQLCATMFRIVGPMPQHLWLRLYPEHQQTRFILCEMSQLAKPASQAKFSPAQTQQAIQDMFPPMVRRRLADTAESTDEPIRLVSHWATGTRSRDMFSSPVQRCTFSVSGGVSLSDADTDNGTTSLASPTLSNGRSTPVPSAAPPPVSSSSSAMEGVESQADPASGAPPPTPRLSTSPLPEAERATGSVHRAPPPPYSRDSRIVDSVNNLESILDTIVPVPDRADREMVQTRLRDMFPWRISRPLRTQPQASACGWHWRSSLNPDGSYNHELRASDPRRS